MFFLEKMKKYQFETSWVFALCTRQRFVDEFEFYDLSMQLRPRPIHPSPSYPTPRLTALNKTEYSLTLSITPSVLFFYIILLYISPSLFSFSCSFSKSFCLNLYLYLAPPLSFLYQSLSVISFSGSSLISIFFLCLSQYLSISPYLAPAL